MSAVVVVFAWLCAWGGGDGAVAAPQETREIYRTTDSSGRVRLYSVEEKRLLATRKWSPEAEDPPLSVTAAVNAALKRLRGKGPGPFQVVTVQLLASAMGDPRVLSGGGLRSGDLQVSAGSADGRRRRLDGRVHRRAVTGFAVGVSAEAAMDILAVLVLGATLSAGSDVTGAIVVRTVDEMWRALPGIPIRVKPVADCRARQGVGGSVETVTRSDGSAQVDVPTGAFYELEIPRESGWEGLAQCLRVAPGGPAYLQFRLRVDPRNTVRLEQPSLSPPDRSRRLMAAQFAGAYVDAADRAYVVSMRPSDEGVDVEFPDLSSESFPRRLSDTDFAGQAGTVSFVVKGGRSVGFSWKPAVVAARRSGGG
jgi:hypothetical protein